MVVDVTHTPQAPFYGPVISGNRTVESTPTDKSSQNLADEFYKTYKKEGNVFAATYLISRAKLHAKQTGMSEIDSLTHIVKCIRVAFTQSADLKRFWRTSSWDKMAHLNDADILARSLQLKG